jgi:hypothetical protein
MNATVGMSQQSHKKLLALPDRISSCTEALAV